MKKLFVFFIILGTVVFSAHTGIFFAGKTRVTVGNRTLVESRLGSMLGVATAGIYRLETLFGFFSDPPDIKITSRTYTVYYPASYTGITQNTVIPGAQLHFFIELQNIANSPVYNCVIEDIVPENTHFYSGRAPGLTGNCTNIVYEGVTTNVGAGNPIRFRFDLAPLGRATFNYTVTVD